MTVTKYIPQSSSSDRYEAARKALAEYDENEAEYAALPDIEQDGRDYEIYEDAKLAAADTLAAALRALITPPGIHETEADMVQTVIQNAPAHVSGKGIRFQYDDLIAMVTAAIRAGIQSAHESWECEDRPTQEQMLRWLELDYDEGIDDEGNYALHVYSQYIERKDD